MLDKFGFHKGFPDELRPISVSSITCAFFKAHNLSLKSAIIFEYMLRKAELENPSNIPLFMSELVNTSIVTSAGQLSKATMGFISLQSIIARHIPELLEFGLIKRARYLGPEGSEFLVNRRFFYDWIENNIKKRQEYVR